MPNSSSNPLGRLHISAFQRSVVGYIRAHKIISIIVFLALAYGGYSLYGSLTSTAQETRYVTSHVTKNTIVSTITGTGQVAATSQVDVKPKGSGTIVSVPVVNGQKVFAGQLLVALDSTDAQKAVRDAQVNLDSAKLALQKLTQSADALSLAQAQNSLTQASTTLAQGYDDGYNNVASTFLDLPGIMTNLDNVIYGYTVNTNQDNISAYLDKVKDNDPSVQALHDDAITKYTAALAAYKATLTSYKASSRFSDYASIESLISQTYQTTKSIADAAKSLNDFLNFVNNNLSTRHLPIPTILTTHQTTLSTAVGQSSSHLASLLSNITTISTSKQSITEKNLSLSKLQGGADPLDIQSSQLSVIQRQNALLDAQQTYANYFVRAPFAGTIAKLSAQKGDTASGGTAVATLITPQQVASISLNEVDAEKVKTGQKATLTFDAIDGLTIAGTVADMDTVGTVSQGVVTYTIRIAFDTSDDRVRPGMSVSASVITAIHPDTLVVPSSAVKTRGANSYVEIFTPPLAGSDSASGTPATSAPTQLPVTVGLSNETETEILSGLSEGDQVVSKTITAAKTTTSASAPSLIGGGGGFGGGGARPAGRTGG